MFLMKYLMLIEEITETTFHYSKTDKQPALRFITLFSTYATNTLRDNDKGLQSCCDTMIVIFRYFSSDLVRSLYPPTGCLRECRPHAALRFACEERWTQTGCHGAAGSHHRNGHYLLPRLLHHYTGYGHHFLLERHLSYVDHHRHRRHLPCLLILNSCFTYHNRNFEHHQILLALSPLLLISSKSAAPRTSLHPFPLHTQLMCTPLPSRDHPRHGCHY